MKYGETIHGRLGDAVAAAVLWVDHMIPEGWTTECDRCDQVIGPGVPHVTVTRHMERFNRRGTHTVLEADVLLTLCVDCDMQQPVNAL